jgi:steroid Delta-isomerase
MVTSEEIQTAVEEYVQSFVTADKDRFLSVLAPDVVQEDPVGSTPNRGREALERFWDSLWATCAKIDFESRELYVAGSEAALVFTLIQHTRAGAQVTVDGVDTFRIDGEGRIAVVRGFGKVR